MQIIYVTADPMCVPSAAVDSADSLMNHRNLPENSLPPSCALPSQDNLTIDAKLAQVQALMQTSAQLLQAFQRSQDELRQCVKHSKANLDALLARPHVSDRQTRSNRIHAAWASCLQMATHTMLARVNSNCSARRLLQT